MDLLGDTSAHQSESHPAEPPAAGGVPSGDPLLDLFGSSQPIATQPVLNQPPPTAPIASQVSSGGGGLMDLLGGDLLMTQPAARKLKCGLRYEHTVK